jgi:hypothetical protein
MAYHAIYLPRRMMCVLPTHYIPEDKLKKIEQRAIRGTLCKGGSVSSFPRAAVFGPPIWRHSHGATSNQTIGCKQAIIILKHLQCAGENQAMLRIMLAWAQLETGMGFALLECPEKKVPHLECTWLQSIRTGLATIIHIYIIGQRCITFMYSLPTSMDPPVDIWLTSK